MSAKKDQIKAAYIRAVIYIRYSSHRQDGSFTVEAQHDECMRYLERKGYKFIRQYVDTAKSGKKVAGRDAFDEMIQDAHKGLFDRIVVFTFSRAFRNTKDALNYNFDLKEKCGVVIESVVEPVDMESPHGKFSATNLFAMHELQSDIIAGHVRSGMYYAAQEGEIAYVGVIGSRKKTAVVNARLREAGISEEAIATVHTPIGTHIKAVTPAEIAISIAGEMIYERALRREADGERHKGCPMH